MVPFLVSKILVTSSQSMQEVLSSKGCIYTFLNPVSYLDALEHEELFRQFDGIFVDGSLLVGAIKLLYRKSVVRRSFDTTSLAPDVFQHAEREGQSVYIVATRQEQVERAVKVLHSQYPLLNIVGYRNGYFSSEGEIDSEVRRIEELSPDFLIVGMGAITQERFLLKAKNGGFHGIGFTCGGFIHQIAENKVVYYPQWVDKLNLRFLYRAYKEPHTRIRYAKAFFLFPVRFFREWLDKRTMSVLLLLCTAVAWCICRFLLFFWGGVELVGMNAH